MPENAVRGWLRRHAVLVTAAGMTVLMFGAYWVIGGQLVRAAVGAPIWGGLMFVWFRYVTHRRVRPPALPENHRI
jgi:hypothetical protein